MGNNFRSSLTGIQAFYNTNFMTASSDVYVMEEP